jgi:hypothetical protein
VEKIYRIKIKVPVKKGRIFRLGLVTPLVIMAVTLSSLMSLSMIGRTVAYYYDDEKSQNNFFAANILDFNMDASGSLSGWDGSYYSASGSFEIYLPEGGSFEQEVVLNRVNEADFKYKVATYKISGEEPVCQNLRLSASLDGLEIYNGNLLAFISSENMFTAPADDWVFEVSLPGEPFKLQSGQFCEFSIMFKGWQENLLSFPFGFHDKEKISSKVVFEPDEKAAGADLDIFSIESILESPIPENRTVTESIASPSADGTASDSAQVTPEPVPSGSPQPTPTAETSPLPSPTASQTPTPSLAPEHPSSGEPSSTPQPSSNPEPTLSPSPLIDPSPSPETTP